MSPEGVCHKMKLDAHVILFYYYYDIDTKFLSSLSIEFVKDTMVFSSPNRIPNFFYTYESKIELQTTYLKGSNSLPFKSIHFIGISRTNFTMKNYLIKSYKIK